MKKQLFILFLSLAFAGFAQEDHSKDTVFIKYNIDESVEEVKYKVDTVLFDSPMMRQILIGTTVLPWTHNQLTAKGFGVDFEKVTKSDCQQPGDFGGIGDHINSIQAMENTLTIDFNIYDNCCYEFLCDIAVDEAGVLNLIYTGYGSYCGCECCFGLTYYLSVTKGVDYPSIQAVMINGDPKTMRKIE